MLGKRDQKQLSAQSDLSEAAVSHPKRPKYTETEENKLEYQNRSDQANSEEISPSAEKLIMPKPVEWKTKRTVSTKYNLGGAVTIQGQDGDQPAMVKTANIQMRFTDKQGRRQYTRETKADKKGKKVGRWTRTEHIRFI